MSEWSGPREVSDLELAFGGGMDRLLPPRELVPEAMWLGRHPYARFFQTWFGTGLKDATYFSWREGVDQDAALRHIRTVLGSWEPKHEHKIGGLAYLLSLWCDAVLIVHADGSGTVITPDGTSKVTEGQVALYLEPTGEPVQQRTDGLGDRLRR